MYRECTLLVGRVSAGAHGACGGAVAAVQSALQSDSRPDKGEQQDAINKKGLDGGQFHQGRPNKA